MVAQKRRGKREKGKNPSTDVFNVIKQSELKARYPQGGEIHQSLSREEKFF